jgi:choline dehydrogenase-like flavoprotein
VFVDLNELPDGRLIEADVAVVGAGAAGIALARELAGGGRRVVLAESGALDPDGETQSLYEGDVIGMAYEPLVAARQRSFGGTTGMWTGWCKPLDAVDMAPRPWLGLKGWPVTREALQPFYERAQVLVEAGPYRYDRGLWDDIDAPLYDPDPERLGYTFWQKSPPTRFGHRYREDLERAGSATVLLDANLVEIVSDPEGGRVEHLELRSLRGRAARLRAGAYVLACGGIENARLLLASDRARPEGLGNRHGLVGRYFMEHPHWDVATIVADDPYALLDSYYRRNVGGRDHRIGWNLAEAHQERLGALNCVAELTFDKDPSTGSYAAGAVWRQLRRGEFPDHLGDRAAAVLGDLGGVARSAWRKAVGGTFVNKPVGAIRLMVTLDPMPNPQSRVTLTDARDALGMRRAALDWRLTPEDERSIEALTRAVSIDLTRLGLGRVRVHPALTDPAGGWARAGHLRGYDIAPEAPEMAISWHHIGTTRMAADPREGVVDADCRVHGVSNLYVAGSSVFPTAGNANPTLTIVALALRLADHLEATRAA